MANITGTETNDLLQGTPDADNIQALGGNDTILGSKGVDTVDGGAGNDTLDYRNVNYTSLTFNPVTRLGSFDAPIGSQVTLGSFADSTNISNSSIETIVANPANLQNNNISFGRSRFISGRQEISVDLTQDRVDFYAGSDVQQTIFAKNFQNVNGATRVVGNDLDNIISNDLTATRATVIGSKGNDTISNGLPDYSNLGQAVTFLPTVFVNGPPTATVDKGSFGKDTVKYVSSVIGAIDRANTVDGSAVPDGASLNVNLLNNSVQGNLFGGTWSFGVTNFVNVVGTKNNDTIVGSNQGGTLTGGDGDDTITGGAGKDIITGGSGNDTIAGTNATARGVGEVDTLTGSGGADKFVLGDKSGAYYVGNGANDYASITDFNIFQDSIDIGSLKNFSFGYGGNDTIDLFSGKKAGNRDLIAKIKIENFGSVSNGIGTQKSANSSRSASLGGTDTSVNVDALASQFKIFAGENLTNA